MPVENRTATITAVGKYLPERILTNHDLEKMMDTSDEWIRSRTGIIQRHIVAKGEATSDMCTAAVQQILKKKEMDPSEIDCIIVATITPDMLFPSTAALVQDKLGASNAWGFDLSAACSGFLFGLDTATRFIESGQYDKIIVIGADTMSSVLDYEDRATAVLFGDGAGAVLVEATENDDEGVIDSILRVDGSGGKYLYMPAGGSLNPATAETVSNRDHYLKQDGRNVYKSAIKGMADVTAELAERNNLKGDDISLFIPHQANKRIIDAAAARLGLREDQVLSNIHNYGNTTGGTIPLGIADAVEEQRLHSGDNLVLAAFGAGYTWGAMYIKWGHAV
ncbi:MAG: ketoacyl-ACP synthase III [Candidatus Marinimicrobia bacterium]|nr:ketoacyl-ACP synthase III [Candidatus Neomarinimicrobiota bacterium]